MTGPADPDAPSADIEALASERAEARAARDFARADALKASIEAAGWKVVDDGRRYTLAPARAADRNDEGRVVFGSAATVPSLLGDVARDSATAIVLVADHAEDALFTVGGLAASTGPGIDVVVVAADGSVDRSTLIDGLGDATGVPPFEVGGDEGNVSARRVEVLWTIDAMSVGESLEAGLRRAAGAIVLVFEPGAEPEGDPVPGIHAALGDATIAVVGREGLVSGDLHRFERAEADDAVAALGPTLIGFRRADATRLEGIDRRLSGYDGVIAWSSLALREAGDGVATRRAVALELPVRARPAADDGDERGAAVARRDRYRIGDRFGGDAALAG